ncbi:MAG: MFS transporter [Rhodanobacter sp.]|nr:MAG: MFS transporter [Rhodanobacter sp.]TAM06198.1 MAG: MFS transporter [Rhodanobacter sp.]TAM41441.1 MAG: MFS transporter [Rhodanobacter sp.]TAN29360.1 MAG: MFS transporter [Rhodanobacter sp.]
MLRTLRPIASLLAGTALLLLGVGLLNTLIPLRGDMYGYSNTLLGGLTSAYYAGYLVGTFTIPPLVQRIGYIRTFAFCTACVACVVLLHALSHAPLLWLALRLLTGVVLVGLYMLIESWLNASAQPAQRGSVFAAYMVVNLGALALAQQLLRIDGQPFVLFTVVALLICAATLPVVATRLAQPVLQPTPKLRLSRLFAAAPSAGVGALLSGLGMGAFWGLLPVYVKNTGFEAAEVGTYMSVAIVGGALLQWPLGRLSDRHDRRIALALVCAAAGALAIVAPFLAGLRMASLTIIFLYGGTAFAVYPIVVAHLVDHLPPEDLMAASSSVLLLYGVGSALGPLIAGALMSATGPWSLFGWFALVHGAIAVYAGYRYQTFRRTGADEAHFRPMLRTTPSALELMPETDGPEMPDAPST